MRTRFAPSPTGYLHIGGVRTALFNWLLARRLGGKFILRIDDTDAERNRPEALQPILDGFRWLGIDWDEGPEVGGDYGPYFQSQRGTLYREAAVKLIASGHAYPDASTKEQLEQQRMDQGLEDFKLRNPNATAEELEKEVKFIKTGNRKFVFRGANRDKDPQQNLKLFESGGCVLRFKIPAGKTIAFNDLIAGPVEFESDKMGDPVILRAEGNPLYSFATVVDEISMKITHVIRAVEHLANTPGQVLFYEALGASIPHFAHVPVVNAPKSKEKLSKRKMKQFMTDEVVSRLRASHAVPPDMTDEQIKAQEDLNPATVAFYRILGYLPAAIVNYFGRLGWSLDDKTEIIGRDEMVKSFSLDRVNNAPASFDPEKLLWLAGEYMRMLPIEEKIDGVIPFLRRAGLVGETVDRDLVRKVVEACGDRLKIFSDIFEYASFFFRDPIYDPKAVEKRLKKDGVAALIDELSTIVEGIEPFDVPTIEQRMKAFAEAKGIKIGDLNHVLRVAVSGIAIGPGVFEILAILGKNETRRRLAMAQKLV